MGLDDDVSNREGNITHEQIPRSTALEESKISRNGEALTLNKHASNSSLSSRWLEPVINHVKQLRAQTKSLEREHEDAVAHFFELLGYKRGSEIKFQRGRVDILIDPDDAQNKSKIVIEVKRNWALSKKNLKYIHQAHRYALENGAQIVIVTNGDLYLIYDREKGLGLSDQFVGAFQLTQLTDSGIELAESLKRDRPGFEREIKKRLDINWRSDMNPNQAEASNPNVFERIKNFICRTLLGIS